MKTFCSFLIVGVVVCVASASPLALQDALGESSIDLKRTR